ncbi:hypothetical protein ACQJBY_004806 [Aegilops geniculata]
MTSSSWKNWTDHDRKKWRDALTDRDFWLYGYQDTPEHLVLFILRMATAGEGLIWNVGVGPKASFTQAITNHIFWKNKTRGFNHMIKVDLNLTPTSEEALGSGITSIKYQIAVAAAKELGLLDQEYNRLKERNEELLYYSYGDFDEDASGDLENYVKNRIVPRIIKQLSTEKYFLMVENLQFPTDLGSFTLDVGLPPSTWADSCWFISTTNHDAYNESKSKGDKVISIEEDDSVMVLIMYSLHQSAYDILNKTRKENEYWLDVALNCFHYAIAIFAQHSQWVVTSDELIHHWSAQGILPCITIKEEEEIGTYISKCAYMQQVGRVILEAFEKYSLLQLPFSHANGAYEATSTGAQFIAYHGLIAKDITVDELLENKKKWISFVGDHGCHVSLEWLNTEETKGTRALILRGCHTLPILSKLDHFLSELPFLRVLDLSYTPIKVLPSSIGCLLNLRLLSLRGCHDLKTLSSSSATSATDSPTNISSSSPLSTLYQLEILDMNGAPFSHLTQDMASQMSNLIYLDMSYSLITTFPPNFFKDMSNLEELILVSCSNLVELPPSMALLSTLTTLEISGSQIKYFPQKMFEEMLKLHSIKLIDNKELISLTGPISSAQGIKLEGHPNLVSFVLIGASHIRCLSLRGCRKLESVEIKNLGALEEIDLSCTAIVEFPADIINSTQLRRLLLLGVPSLRRFPWHNLERLPDVFYLDQCIEGDGHYCDEICQVCVSDPRFFHSFRYPVVDLVSDGWFFQSFYVRVAPCNTSSRRQQDKEDMLDSKLQVFVQNQSTYVDVYSSCYAQEIRIESPVTVPLHRTERHVEITGMKDTTLGLYDLLNVTTSISVTCDTSMEYFSDLNSFDELEECELLWCHKMEGVFRFWTSAENLRNMHVYNMISLVSFCSQHQVNFKLLAHLHLEYCPRLEYMVTHATTLPCLKILAILFCYNLKKIFSSDDMKDDTYQLPSLQKIRLQELPLLKHVHNNDVTITAPVWKELQVRGCWNLRRLPRLQEGQPKMVKVNGERSWWRKLQWGSLLHRDNYEPKLPPKFASFNKRAEMSSYLR